MSMPDQGYGRGWQRFGFDSLEFVSAKMHGGGSEIDFSVAVDRGVGRPFVAYVVIAPDATEAPPLGMHIHRSAELGRDVEEWYIIIDGTGIQRFTNGDSVEFGPGDLIAVYPGTGHSLEVTGNVPVRMLGILPEVYMTMNPDAPAWPETWNPRIRVLTTTAELCPETAECSDCGQTWRRPETDVGSSSIASWAEDHACTTQASRLHLAVGQGG
jgi:mannose-6-phosphate isomerase-like protein (cupin superfamily)